MNVSDASSLARARRARLTRKVDRQGAAPGRKVDRKPRQGARLTRKGVPQAAAQG